MTNSLAKLIFIFSLLLTSCAAQKGKKTTVEIINNFLDGTTLIAHCKSGDDDLGVQNITTTWGFSFVPSFWRNTLFFCSFAWPGQSKYFDIYVQKRDEDECSLCSWRISPNGPCRFNEITENFDICYPWNPST
ncbi:hypothetical protein BT93_G0059 [Corymbia citriodora subsp. variegata]|nr:hypothetical protein BT93_G0059 [Corymbia citriodora subsp. variegata]